MKRSLFAILAITGLLLTIVPSMLIFAGGISAQTNKILMAIGMLLWFISAPFWIKRS